MYRLAIIPLPDGAVDYTVFDSTEEIVIAQGSIAARDLSASTLRTVFPSLDSEGSARVMAKLQSIGDEDDALQVDVLEW